MEWLKNVFNRIKSDPTVTRRLYAVTFAAALFLLVLTVKGPEEQGRLITDRNGNIKEIQRHSSERAER